MSRLEVMRASWRALMCTLGLLLSAPEVHALEVTISAEYLGGGSGKFDNTTPPSAVCQFWALCRTLPTVELPIAYVKETTKGAPDPRDGFFIQLPGRREVDVYHDQTGEARRMNFEWTALNQTVRISRGTLINNHPIFSNSNALIGGCRGIGSTGQERPPTVKYFWRVIDPQSPQGCSSSNIYSPQGYVTDAIVEQMSAAYSLDIPAPYRLRAGIYRGSLTYRIGPGGDFDLGNDVSQLSGDTLTVNFELDVRHAFLFEFPPGSERAVLEPNGGWSAWLAGGRAPTTLYRDLPFRLWSTGPFKVYKLCEHTLDVRCAIVNDSSHQVPVEVALSLPGGMQYQGQPIGRLALPSGRAAAFQFDSVIPTLNRPGQLHFKVARADVPSMLAYSGSTYTGQVTVVFDAEL